MSQRDISTDDGRFDKVLDITLQEFFGTLMSFLEKKLFSSTIRERYFSPNVVVTFVVMAVIVVGDGAIMARVIVVVAVMAGIVVVGFDVVQHLAVQIVVAKNIAFEVEIVMLMLFISICTFCFCTSCC